MNQRFKEIFTGKVVNKRLTFNTGMDEFPRYMLEYLIDMPCGTPDDWQRARSPAQQQLSALAAARP
jgi:predicted ATP-dependent Lon-type protease